MAKKYLSPLNLLNLTSDPGTAAEGDFYWNSSTNRLRIYFDGAWADVSSNTVFTNQANTFTVAPQQITINNAANKGLIIRGASSQSANLLELQDSAGTNVILAKVNGSINARYFDSIASTGTYLDTNLVTNSLVILGRSTTAVTTIIRAVASQTSDLLQWQNSAGGVLAKINQVGSAVFGDASINAVGNLNAFASASNVIPLVVRGASSQSASLQEWQNTAGTVVASLAVDGAIRGNYLTNNANTNPYLDISGSSVVILNRNTVGNTVFAVRGMASQSGNLQVWQNSSLTNLRAINAAGQEYLDTSVISPFNIYTEAGSNNSMVSVPNDIYADKLRFRIGTYETSVDAITSWTAGTFQRELIDGRNDTGVSLSTTNKGHRWTWNAGDISWAEFKYVRLTTTYSSPSTTYDLLVESSANGSTWTSRGSWTGQSAYISKRIFAIGYTGGDSYLRITITNNAMTAAIPLANIEALSIRPGDQGGAVSGIEENLPLWWNGDRSVRLQPIVATGVPLVTRGFTSQSANLQEWQNSSSTVLASIDANGQGSFKSTTLTASSSSGSALTLVAAGGQTADLLTTAGGAKIPAAGNYFIAPGIYSTFLMYADSGSATQVALRIKGFASQTASLTEWQNSSGTVLSYISASGNLFAPGIRDAADTGSYINMNAAGAVSILTRSTTNIGLIVKGVASQSADLQQWQDSTGAVVAKIQTNGRLTTDVTFVNYVQNYAGTGAYFDFINYGNGIGLVGRTNAAANMFVIRGMASQTGDLQQWQNTGGTVISKVDASGNLTAASFVKTSGTSSQFLKADGSVDSSTYLTTGTAASTYLPLTGGTVSSDLTITGSLTVNGTTTNLNSTNLVIEDKNIIIADVASPTNTTADGAGITIKGATDKTFNWVNATGAFTSSEPLSAPSITLTNSRTYGFTRTMPTVVDNIVELGSSTLANGGGTFEISVVVPSSGFSVAKQYLIPVNYDETTNEWRIVNPIADGGPFSNDFTLEINVNLSVASFRLRRSLGTTAGTAYISMTVNGNAPVFTESSATSSVTAPTRYYNSAILTQKDGTVTINGAASNTTQLVIKKLPLQSADLQQWQNDSSVAVASVSPGGIFTATSIVKSGGTSSQFLKADGSVDSSTYITAAQTFNLGTTSIALNRASAAQSLTGITSIDGSAATLTTSRNIGDVAFNGSANIVPTRMYFKDTRSTNYNPYTYAGVTLHLKTNTTDSLSDGGTYHGVLNLTHWDDSSGGVDHQLGLTDNGNMHIRYSTGASSWSSWNKFVLADSTNTFTGQIISTRANNAGDGLGQIYLNGATGNRIDFNTNGVAAPTFTTRSTGTKIVLYPNISASTTDFAIGVEGGTLWQSVENSSAVFKWYAGTTNVMTLRGSGALSLNSTSSTLGDGSVTHQLGIVSGAATNIGLVVRAAASQTGDLQQWQNSAGTNVARVLSNGQATFGTIYVPSVSNTSTGNNSLVTMSATGTQITTALQTNIALAIQNTNATPTGNLTEWRNTGGTAIAIMSASGAFSAVTKSFDIEHPTKEGMRLRYGSLEGPENGVYVRGRSKQDYIALPDHWVGLVDEDTITVNITPVGKKQDIYVDSIEDNKVYLGGKIKEYFFTVYGERKDVDKLLVEY